MITEKLIEQYYGLMIHKEAQKYAIAYLEGNEVKYPHSKNYLTRYSLTKALEGKETIGVFLSQDKTGLVKAGAIDIDTPRDAENLVTAYALATHIQTVAKTLDIQLEIEFSGNRGYHLWLFSETPVTGQLMQDCLKVICSKADFDCKEYFPNNTPESKCIKLPGVIHLKTNLKCGFVGTNHNPNNIELPNQEFLLKTFKQNTVEKIVNVANSLTPTAKSENENRECDLSSFGDNHPTCINHLLANGVPTEIDYNSGNLTLARYCLSKGLNHQESLALAKKMAEATKESHPTAKDYQGKVANFESVYKSATINGYKFKCSYVLAKRGDKPLSSRGCIGIKCKACDFTNKNESINQKPEINDKHRIKPYNALIFQVMSKLLGAGKESVKSAILCECENELKSINESIKNQLSEGENLKESEVLGYLLQQSENFCNYSEIPKQGFIGGSNVSIAEYLDYLYSIKVPSEDTLKDYIENIRERGVKKLTSEALLESQNQLKTDEKVEITLANIITKSENLSRKVVDEIQSQQDYLPQFTVNLFSYDSVAIPTPSPHLNNILNGGFQLGKLYVLGAPPGHGKSTFCSWCGDYAASKNIKVVYASYEMSREQLTVVSLARIGKLNSASIEGRKFLKDDYLAKETLENRVLESISNYSNTIAHNLHILEADNEYTVLRLKNICKKLKTNLLIVDYLQLLSSGDLKLDNTYQETLRVSKIATELKRLARETEIAVIAISDINKEAYNKAILGGDLDMGALRDSFKIAHSADTILLLQSQAIILGKGNNKQKIDQLGLLAKKYPDKQHQIERIKSKYPLNKKTCDTYARVTIVKNRGGKLGEPIFRYSRALHDFECLDFDVEIEQEDLDI